MDNLLKLDGKQFSWQGYQGTACASDLGIPPGRWPETLRVESHRTGNTMAFAKACRLFNEVSCTGMPKNLVPNGETALEFVGVEYTSPEGVKLLILND